MGGPLRNLIANVRENIQERQAERRGHGNCNSTFEGCRTQHEGFSPRNEQVRIGRNAASQAGTSYSQINPALTNSAAAVAPLLQVCGRNGCYTVPAPNNTPAASTTTAPSSPKTESTVATSKDTKGGVIVADGVRADIKDGKIRVSVTDGAQATIHYSYKETFSNYEETTSSKLDTIGPKGYHSNGASFFQADNGKDLIVNARASNVDEIKLTIPDGKGGKRDISISKDSILKAEAAAEKTAAEAKKVSAQAGQKIVEEIAEKAVTDIKKRAEEAGKNADTKNTTAPTVKPDTEASKEYNPTLSAAATELHRLLGVNTGLVSNTPTDPDFAPKLDKLLQAHPTLEKRVELVEAADPAKLGEALHEAEAFSGVFDKIAEPLNKEDPSNVSKLKSAIDLLHSEHSKTLSSYDPNVINQSFKVIDSLPKGAESLAAVYWSKIRNDETFSQPETYAEMKDTLKKGVAAQSEVKPEPAQTPVQNTEYDPQLSGMASEVRNVLATTVGWNPLYNTTVDSQHAPKLDAILAKFPSQGARAKLIDSIGADQLGLLLHELPTQQSDEAMGKFFTTLGDEKTKALKDAVDTLIAEYDKSGNPFASAFDKGKIQQAFNTINGVGEGAESFAKMYWYKKGNDSVAFYANKYEDMQSTLQGALKTE